MTPVPKPLARGKKPKKRLSKVRKTSRAKLAREADKLWSLAIRRGGFCEICGNAFTLQGAHGFSRRYRGTRWLLINGFCLCSGCHVRMTHDPLAWDDYIRVEWGAETYAELKALAQSKCVPDYEGIIADLKRELAR